MRRNRPSAFDVSFPDVRRTDDNGSEGQSSTVGDQSRSSSVASTSTAGSSLGKRKGVADEENGRNKRPHIMMPKTRFHKTMDYEIQEDAKLVIADEDLDELEDDEKLIREIYNFEIFDPSRRNEMVLLDALEQDDGVDRQFEAAGDVWPAYLNSNDEDEGQEDEDEERPKKGQRPQNVRLSAILRFWMDYTNENEPVYIETQYAWYILKTPSEKYRETWMHFYLPNRVAQLVIASALELPRDTSYGSFLRNFTARTMMGRTFVENDLTRYAAEIQEAILQEPEMKTIMATQFVQTILSKAPATRDSSRHVRRKPVRAKVLPKKRIAMGNVDLDVLKPENQNPTCVTPRIAKLAEGKCKEELKVIGSAPPPINKGEKAAKAKKERKALWSYILRSHAKKRIKCDKKNRVSLTYDIYKTVEVSGETYSIGDVVIVRSSKTPATFDKLDEDATVADYFWFAKIIYIVMDNESAHIQWFNHGSWTMLEELAHPQELFLAEHCDKVSLHKIAGKVKVHMYSGQLPEDHSPSSDDDYFCRYMYKYSLGSFTSLDLARLELCASQQAPDNCPVCPIIAEGDTKTSIQELKDEQGIRNGVTFGGQKYHYEDFVLYRAVKGPAHIGYITGIKLEAKDPSVIVRKVGRMTSLDHILPIQILRDERHLYLTDEKTVVKIQDLVKVIYVPCDESFETPNNTREDWLTEEYDQFYLKYVFPRLQVKKWDERRRVKWQELNVCSPCCSERLKRRNMIQKYLDQARHQPLSTLDLFGGVGAFSRGLVDGSGSLKVTHAIELSPSAAQTFRRNSPETIVYNQCANEMLRYTIKSQQGHKVERPKQKFDNETPVPPPPKPTEIKVITAGFPCQSHSTLNMFKNAEDIKNNLILTTLSFMDYYSPSFGYFENVPGFLKFALNAQQADPHNVKGGIKSGGLKLFVRALLDMDYQVRFGLLQAAHYGTPQRRVRFFIVAAKHGEILPELPQPTHDFPENKTLEIKLGNLGAIEPIRSTAGTAQNKFVSIEDAIGDLPRFDWKNPNPRYRDKLSSAQKQERRKREAVVPSFECKGGPGLTYCGIQGQVEYHDRPKTRYQQTARLVDTTDIQQFTKILIPKKVERVVNIPLRANADYQSLPRSMGEWQLVDPSSSIGRKNYRSGAYGRLDKDSVFQTTVTNVDPTAKQCHVLHPWCERMLTVRELARSQGFPDNFVFKAIANNVVTMHRQIGNAVPIPLGHALGRELRESLFIKWKSQRDNAIVIPDDDEPKDHNEQHYQRRFLFDEDDDKMDIDP